MIWDNTHLIRDTVAITVSLTAYTIAIIYIITGRFK